MKRPDISCSPGTLDIVETWIKRVKVLVKVLDNVSKKYLDTTGYIKDNFEEVCENENISVEEIFYFVGLLF